MALTITQIGNQISTEKLTFQAVSDDPLTTSVRMAIIFDPLGLEEAHVLEHLPDFGTTDTFTFEVNSIMKDYFDFQYGAGSDMAEMADSLGEGISNRERSESVVQELDSHVCGVIQLIVTKLVSASLADLTNLLASFTVNIDLAFQALQSFIDALEEILDGAFASFDLKSIDFIATFLKNILIYAIPIICTSALVIAFVLSQIYLPDKNTIVYLSSGVFVLSVANIFLHSAIGNLFQLLADFKVPLFQFNLVLGRDYFNTQIASVFNIASCIVIILNYVLPIPRFTIKDMYKNQENPY